MTDPVAVACGVGTRSAGSSCTGTYGRSPAAGNLLVAAVAGGSTNTANFNVAQHSGTTGWSQVAVIGTNGATSFGGVAFFTKVAAGADAAPTFDCTLGAANIGSWCTIWEIWNPAASPVDTTGTVAGGGTAASRTSLPVTTAAAPSDPGNIVLYASATIQSTAGAATYSLASNVSANLADDGANSYNTHFDFQGYWEQQTVTSGALTISPSLSNAQSVFWSAACIVIKGGTAVPAAGTPTPVGGPWMNNGAGLTGQSISPNYTGDALLFVSKISSSALTISSLSDSAGITTGWTRIQGPFVDTQSTPHTHEIWLGKSTGTGVTNLNFTFSGAIGSTGVEVDCIEFSNNQGSASPGSSEWTTWSYDKGGTANNTTAGTTIAWPSETPAKSNGEIWAGRARTPSGGPFGAVTPSPLGSLRDTNNNALVFGSPVSGATAASLTQQASTQSFVICSLISQAVVFPVAGSSVASSSASATLGMTTAISGTSATPSSGTGGFVGTIVISALSSASSQANGAFSGVILAISASSSTGSFAAGNFVALLTISGWSATQSFATGPTIPPGLYVPPPGGSQLPVTVYWYDGNLNLQGIVPFYSLVATLNYNAVGSWTIIVPYSTAMWNMVMSGTVIIHVDWMGLYQFGGKCEMPQYSDSIPGSRGAGQVPGRFITLSGADYLALIANRIAYPAPTVLWNSQTATAKDSQTAVSAETAIKHYVNVNVGPGAIASRYFHLLSIATDSHRGSNVNYTVQFLSGVDLNLMDIIRTLTVNGGPLGVRITKTGPVSGSGGGLLFDCYVPRDLSKTAWFSETLGNLTSVSLSITDPTITNACTQGATTFYEAFTTGSTADWTRCEDFVDQASQTDNIQVQQSAIAALGGGAAGPALSVTASDIPYLTFGRDYGLGDTVTVEVVPGVTYQDIVSSVTLTADPSQTPPLFVVPVIGASQSNTAPTANVIQSLLARVRLLEKRIAAQRG